MKNTLLLPLLAALSLCACHQEPPPQDPPFVPIDYTVLPPITQEGKNTFGCKVNGEVWVPRIDTRSFDPTRHDKIASLHEKNGSGAGAIVCNLLDFDSKQDDWLQITFGQTFFQPVQNCGLMLGVGALFNTTSGKWYSSKYHDSSNNCVTVTRIDTANNIVSGTFHFVLYRDSVNLNDKIVLSEGRFDMFYYPQ